MVTRQYQCKRCNSNFMVETKIGHPPAFCESCRELRRKLTKELPPTFPEVEEPSDFPR